MLGANLGNNSARSGASNSSPAKQGYTLDGKRVLPPQLIKENILFKLKNNVKLEDLRNIAQQTIGKPSPEGPTQQEVNQMKDQMSKMAHSMLIFQEVHNDVMDFLNGELQLRPTFKQTMDSFRQVIPTIVDARIHEERLGTTFGTEQIRDYKIKAHVQTSVGVFSHILIYLMMDIKIIRIEIEIPIEGKCDGLFGASGYQYLERRPLPLVFQLPGTIKESGTTLPITMRRGLNLQELQLLRKLRRKSWLRPCLRLQGSLFRKDWIKRCYSLISLLNRSMVQASQGAKHYQRGTLSKRSATVTSIRKKHFSLQMASNQRTRIKLIYMSIHTMLISCQPR